MLLTKMTLPLKQLTLNDNNLKNRGAQQVAQYLTTNTTLSELSLASNDIDRIGIDKLTTSFKLNTSLQTLNLHNNKLAFKGTEVLCSFLATNTTIRSVTLSGNGIGLKGATFIGACLAQNSRLTYLNVNKNSLTDANLTPLFEGIEKNKSLLHLHLKDNELCILSNFGKAILQSNLRTFNAANNHINITEIAIFFQKFNQYHSNLNSFLLKNNRGVDTIWHRLSLRTLPDSIDKFLQNNSFLTDLSLPQSGPIWEKVQPVLQARMAERGRLLSVEWTRKIHLLQEEMRVRVLEIFLVIDDKMVARDVKILIISYFILLTYHPKKYLQAPFPTRKYTNAKFFLQDQQTSAVGGNLK
uniref:Uncharacterized protein n=1 Tax=Arcella intermedia TaxID=1963864 RepID=A0A6B2L856_9EUKA